MTNAFFQFYINCIYDDSDNDKIITTTCATCFIKNYRHLLLYAKVM